MGKQKPTPEQRRLQAEILEKTEVKLIENSVKLKDKTRSRARKKKALKTKAA
jgi:hypothetical protein